MNTHPNEARTDVGEFQLGPQRPVRKARPRLSGFDYRGRHAYHIVLTVKTRSEVFVDREFGGWCASQLVESAGRMNFDVLAYCLMPNHAHLLVHGIEDSSNLVAFVQNFKQGTAFHFKRASGDQLWQQSYFDRVLRDDEDLDDIARYIFRNPVAAGLCDDPASYPLSGGAHFGGAPTDRAKAPSLRGPSFIEDHND